MRTLGSKTWCEGSIHGVIGFPVGCVAGGVLAVSSFSSTLAIVVCIRTAEASATRAKMARITLRMGERILEQFSANFRIKIDVNKDRDRFVDSRMRYSAMEARRVLFLVGAQMVQELVNYGVKAYTFFSSILTFQALAFEALKCAVTAVSRVCSVSLFLGALKEPAPLPSLLHYRPLSHYSLLVMSGILETEVNRPAHCCRPWILIGC